MRAALAVEADGADADAVVRAEHLAGGHRAAHDYRGGGSSEKLSSSQFHNVVEA